jgi:hypothetical protein
LAVRLWFIYLCAAMLAPGEAFAAARGWLHLPHADKLAHAGLYGVWVLLLLWERAGSKGRTGPADRWRAALLAAAAGGAFELAQAATGYRSADAWDFAADAAGCAAAALAEWVAVRGSTRKGPVAWGKRLTAPLPTGRS